MIFASDMFGSGNLCHIAQLRGQQINYI